MENTVSKASEISTKLDLFDGKMTLGINVNKINYNYDIIDDIKMYHHIKSSFMSLFNRKTYNFLISHKAKIDERKNKLCWEKMKKITNNYELVHTTHSNKNMSISKYSPLSRSYFKMWEMLNEHDLLDRKSSDVKKTAHLAEGPGGFIEAVINWRKNSNDILNGITLKSDNKDIPGWINSVKFLKKNSNVKISYGEDGTGNLYNLNNIKHFKKTVGKVDFVTADGGFDFSVDFNSQELMSHRLIFCEITTILSIQNIGGNFVCKFFDMFEYNTIQLLWIISLLYDELIITKPYTSRPANSEKYVIGKGFKGISDELLEKMYYIIDNWDILDFKERIEILNSKISCRFLEIISDYNFLNAADQIEMIDKTLTLINMSYNKDEITKNRKIQSKKAIQWCKKYNISINENCYVLKKFKNLKWR